MKYYYGIDSQKIDITDKVKTSCSKENCIIIPSGDCNRAKLFGDPIQFVHKYIFIEDKNGTISKYSEHVKIKVISYSEIIEDCYPVIVSVAKLEADYIEEWVIYHLALGFKKIYLYDNEDTPLYKELLKDYPQVIVNHFPGNNYHKAIQYYVLDHFITNYKSNGIITHCAHIDIDEFITLKKHKDIISFIKDYIHGETIGIGMNWRLFGDSGQSCSNGEPLTQRFKMCQKNLNHFIKILFNVSFTPGWIDCHGIILPENYYVKSTNGNIMHGSLNYDLTNDIIQLNHYKCKTLSEFKYIRTRGRADHLEKVIDDMNSDFNLWNFNEVEDTFAYNFYKNIKNTFKFKLSLKNKN